MSESQQTTVIAKPSRRAFLVQSSGERVRGFWWSIVRFTIFRRSPISFNGWRLFLLRSFGADVHSSASIAPSVRIDFPWNLHVAQDVIIDHGVIINCMGEITVGRSTRISQYAHLCAGTHDYTSRDMRILRCPITIGRNVWIAADAFVGPSVTISDGVLLAARSSAFSDLPPDQICIGEPARPRRPWTDNPLAAKLADEPSMTNA